MRSLTISNIRKSDLGFSVLTNSPSSHAITPHLGYLKPGNSVKIRVLLMGSFSFFRISLVQFASVLLLFARL